ncbi:MAG: TolC family protein [Desulfobacteraceae bacterium]|jgi:outer membrane protein TolC
MAPSLKVALVLLASLALAPTPETWSDDTATSDAKAAAENPGRRTNDGSALKITLADAILMALSNNRALQVERLNPVIQRTFEDEARAAFDPGLQMDLSREKRVRRTADLDISLDETDSDTLLGGITLETYFPTGTTLEASAETSIATDDTDDSTLAGTRLGLTVTQALLRGFGRDVNLATLRQARLQTEFSRYELLAFSQSLVNQVETAYWDYALSRRQVDIVAESLRLARQQLAETREMIQVGTLAESELVAVQAEVAIQQQGSIDVNSTLESNRLRLLRLISPPGPHAWDRQVVLVHPPQLPDISLSDVGTHVDQGLRLRPEIRQAELDIQREELEVVRTKNGLLPKLDLFITLGRSGYADAFGDTVSDLDGDSYDTQVGLTLDYPLGKRAAKARHTRARYTRQRAEKALDNLKQLVILDIRIAFLEVNRTRRQIDASSATRRFQEEKLRIETEKFRVGRSTNLLVAQAQRDLLSSRLDEVRAVVSYLEALTNFYRLEGTLLERRGIQVPE